MCQKSFWGLWLCKYILTQLLVVWLGNPLRLTIGWTVMMMYYISPNMQAMSEKMDDFRNRWENYKSNSRKFDRKESCMQWHLYIHFNSPVHRGFLNDVSVTLIDKFQLQGLTLWLLFGIDVSQIRWVFYLKYSKMQVPFHSFWWYLLILCHYFHIL